MKENHGISITGELIDEFIRDGVVIEQFNKEFNVVVSDMLKVITGVIKSPTASPLYLASGVGNPSWDVTPYSANTGNHALVNELFRKQILPDSIAFIDNEGNITEEPTNQLRMEATLDYDECNGDLRELAIFGLTASDTRNSGIMMNHKIHKVRAKDNTKIMRRVVKFTFNI